MEGLKTNEVAYKLKIELKLKKKVRASVLVDYAERCGAKPEDVYGRKIYVWDNAAYQQLKQIYEV